MNFTPKSRQDIASMQVFPKGTYAFEIVEGCDKVSQAGNEMLELKVKVTDSNGASRIVVDYLLEKRAVKLRHAAEACGLVGEYEAGELAGSDFVGRTGMLVLTIEKDKSKVFPDKNAVLDYVVKETGVAGIKLLRRKQQG